MILRIPVENLEKGIKRLSEYLTLLKEKPSEHIEAVWKEKVVLELEELFAYSEAVNSSLWFERNQEVARKMLNLPQDIQNYVEGK